MRLRPARPSRSARSGRTGRIGRIARALAVPALLGLVATAAAPGIVHVRVHSGDTLWGLAQRHHTTVDTLRRLNHIPASSDLILAGALLAVPGNGSAVRPARPGGATATAHYVVRPGDTVTAIARRYRIDPGRVIARNHLPASGLIVVGQRLALPVPARVVTTPAPRRYSSAVSAAVAHDRAVLARRAVPDRAAVRRLVADTARRYGVDPALALGLSYMESGFNQRAVSPADAIGVMQVLPSTGRWLSRDVLHAPVDLFDARDNVRAGVVLLRLLTRAAPLRTAVAGYYQGLASVREHGMYADTRDYVAGVLSLRRQFAGG